MRLLQLDSSGDVALTPDLQRGAIPPYAILSHTWGPDTEEVIFEDLRDGRGKNKAGYEKIRFCAQQAKEDGLQYFWVDTCCINKASLVELSESINSMFRWYQGAQKCYVYLSDISSRKRDSEGSSELWRLAFRNCRWLTRGWTLQELLAPAVVEFYSREGDFLGDKEELRSTLEELTGVPRDALSGEAPMSSFHVQDRIKWVASRETTKAEDKVYCLLGIFAVFMSPIYGEGEEHALGRLKEAIGKSYNNQLHGMGLSSIGAPSLASIKHDPRVHDMPSNPYENLMASLRFDQMDSRQASIKAAYSNTCAWLLRNPVYTKWADPDSLEHHCGFMWIKGKPGVGKSTLVKFARKHANKRKSRDEILISFFFNARGEGLEKSTIGMYRSLLWQILEKAKDIRPILDELPESFQVSSLDWTIDMLRELFTMAVCRLGRRRLRCFIDALDECNEADVRDMIIHLEELGQMSPGRCFVCFASRHYPTIVIRKGKQLIVEDETGHDDDLARYLQNYLRIDPGEFFEDILARTLEKANGVFMWAVLVVPILNEEYRQGRSFAVEKRLEEIPDGLSELFKDILTRDSTNMDALLLCLQWILFAKEPLSREEFYFGMLTTSSTESPAEWNQRVISPDDMDRFVHSTSKGLAELTNTSKTTKPKKSRRPGDGSSTDELMVRVQFIHESVRDFLIKDGGLRELWPELAVDPASTSHDVLKRCCQNYLDLSGGVQHFEKFLESVKGMDMAEIRAKLQTKLPFLKYATGHILYHADRAAISISQHDFLMTFPIQLWARASNILLKNIIDRYPHSPEILYILADNNAPNLIRIASRINYMTYSRGTRFGYPFFAALARKYWDAVRAVLDPAGSSHLDEIVDSVKPYASIGRVRVRKMPPFLWALQEGIKPLADYLLEQIHVDDAKHCDRNGRDALSWAAQRGYREIAIRLLSEGIEIGKVCRSGLAPVHHAVIHGQNAMVKLLLENGADTNWERKGSEENPFHAAVVAGNDEIVELLLDRGAQINLKDKGHTALHRAVIASHHTTIELLLDRGAQTEATDDSLRTSLHMAVLAGHTETAQLLLDRGAQTEATDDSLRTSLHTAVLAGHTETAQLLLDRGAQINAVDNTMWTSLHMAAVADRCDIAKLLLDRGARIDLMDKTDQSALNLAALSATAMESHNGVLQLLLDAEAHTNGQVYEYGDILSAALAKVRLETIQPLLKAWRRYVLSGGYKASFATLFAILKTLTALTFKVDVDVNAKELSNALCTASAGGCSGLVKLLLAIGASADALVDQGIIDTRALCAASENGHKDVVKLLLDAGAHVKFEEGRYGNSLYTASYKGHPEVVRLLLEGGANVNACGCGDDSALYAASYQGHQEVVKLLLDRGADVNFRQGRKGHALYAASAKGRHAIVGMLLEAGADVNAKGGKHGTALRAASAKGHQEVIELLREAGADINVSPVQYGNEIKVASAAIFQEVMYLPVDSSADADAPTHQRSDARTHFNNRGNHALADFQMQLMLLEQQNKKRLLWARQEQDNMIYQSDITALK